MVRDDGGSLYPVEEIDDRPLALWSSGWSQLDAIWQLSPGQFTILTGTAGSGKSTFIFNLMLQMAVESGFHIAFWIPENEPTIKHISRELYHWGMSADADAAAKFVREYQWFYQSSAPENYSDKPQTLQTVLNRISARIDDDRVDLVVLDPWNELERAKPRDQMLTDYIGDCLMYARRWAQQWQVALILIAHPTKAAYGSGELSLYDIAGSANFANKPDVGLTIERDNFSSGGESVKNAGRVVGTAKVTCVKSRDQRAAQFGVCEFQVTERGIFIPFEGSGIHGQFKQSSRTKINKRNAR